MNSKQIILTKKFLIQEYVKNNKSIRQISREVNYGHNTIWKYLKKFNIPVRTKSEAKEGKNNVMFGKFGKDHPAFKDNKAVKRRKYYCKEEGCNNEICYDTWRKGNKRCYFCASKLRWQNKEYREKQIKLMFKGMKLTPNKIEGLLNNLLQESLPKEYKFVGDGQIILGGFCPDFINCNGQKKIIELYGNYWHNRPDWKKRDRGRIITYNKLGYSTLIIWQHELQNLEQVISRIMEFNYAEV